MGLALVVVEEHAGRAMHLGNDDPLSAVDDKGAVIGHERDVAHVDILLLDVLDRLGAGFLIGIEYDEAQRDLERRGIGHAALPALIDVVFRRLEFVFDEFEHRSVGEVGNREHRLKDGLQAFIGPAAVRLPYQQKLVVGCLLNLNEVRHLRDFLDFSEKLSYALPTSERLRHHVLSLNRTIGPATCGRTAASSNHRPGRTRRMPFDIRAPHSQAARRSRRLSRGPQSIATVGTGVTRLIAPPYCGRSGGYPNRRDVLPHSPASGSPAVAPCTYGHLWIPPVLLRSAGGLA